MTATEVVDKSLTNRELLRALRRGVNHTGGEAVLPESVAWHIYLELRKRSEPSAEQIFLNTIRGLHSRRSLAGVELPCGDSHPEEHRLVEDDPFLGDLWKAYKKCIRNNRTGPAAQLLRDIEEQLQTAPLENK